MLITAIQQGDSVCVCGPYKCIWASLVAQMVKNVCNAGDPSLIPGSGRSPGEGNDCPLQCSCLENYMDRGVWWATGYNSMGLQRVDIKKYTYILYSFPLWFIIDIEYRILNTVPCATQ